MTATKNFKILALMLTAASSSINIVSAEEYRHETRFTVKFAGVEVGKANFSIKFDDVSYSLEGSGKTTGLVDWAAPTKGTVESSGTLNENKLAPQLHKAFVKEEKKKEESLLLSFADDKVSDIKFVTKKPRKKRNAPKYIPIEAKHMAAVLDPASSLIVPMSGADARDGQKVCNQRFPVFDGETRYDIKLSYKSTKPIKTKGYNGHAYVCQMRYVPIAGHKKKNRSVKEMASNKRMEIWLAPMQGVSVFTPVRIVVGTKWGRFDAVPDYFGAAS